MQESFKLYFAREAFVPFHVRCKIGSSIPNFWGKEEKCPTGGVVAANISHVLVVLLPPPFSGAPPLQRRKIGLSFTMCSR